MGNKVEYTDEFNTTDPSNIGILTTSSINIIGDRMTIDITTWKREDNGNPGKLAGAWLITGRKNDGKISSITPGDRQTMKILCGKYFQWIAYNEATKEFSGTGGGSYTTKDGKYVENMNLFYSDNAPVGTSLEFRFELKDGHWHHSGLGSKEQPIYEIWSTREEVGT